MTTEKLFDLFAEAGETYLKFSDIKNPRVNRPDLHAFLLLNEIAPSEINRSGHGWDIVSCAEHDEIWLSVTLEQLAPVITKEQVEELVACGVYLDRDTESLHMFK